MSDMPKEIWVDDASGVYTDDPRIMPTMPKYVLTPIPQPVGDAEVEDLIRRLRNAPNWKREEFGDWKAARSVYDRTPFEAADFIERILRQRVIQDADLPERLIAGLTGKSMTPRIQDGWALIPKTQMHNGKEWKLDSVEYSRFGEGCWSASYPHGLPAAPNPTEAK